MAGQRMNAAQIFFQGKSEEGLTPRSALTAIGPAMMANGAPGKRVVRRSDHIGIREQLAGRVLPKIWV